MKTTTSPFTILIDTREVKPWTFKEIPGYKGEGKLVVKIKWQSLGHHRGDYTIKEAATSKNCRWRLAIERKSVSDLYSTILSRRRQFVTELEMLNSMEYAAVITEGSLIKVLNYTPKYWVDQKVSEEIRFNRRRSVAGSIQAWQLRYPTVRWWFLPRTAAETWAYRLMYRFWEDKIKGK